MTFEKVRKIMANTLNLKEEDITLEADLMKDLRVDSLDVMEFVMALEEEYGMTVADEELTSFSTVSSIVDYIDSH